MPTLSFTFTRQNDPQAGEALDTPFQAYDHPQFPEGRGHEYIHLQERTLTMSAVKNDVVRPTCSHTCSFIAI